MLRLKSRASCQCFNNNNTECAKNITIAQPRSAAPRPNRTKAHMMKGFEDTKSALYNLQNDPGQLTPLADEKKSNEYQQMMIDIINEYDPPKELIKNYFEN